MTAIDKADTAHSNKPARGRESHTTPVDDARTAGQLEMAPVENALPDNAPAEGTSGQAAPLVAQLVTVDGAHFSVEREDGDLIEEIDVADVIELTEGGDNEIADVETFAGASEAALVEGGFAGEGESASTDGTPGEERPTRKRLEEQLEALKRKESELRRALVIADHPELGDAIRLLQGRAYAIGRVEAKLALGLSKSEERRRDTLDKKLGSLRTKRSELDVQIGALESELHALGAERTAAFELERKEALRELLIALGTHEPALREAGIDAITLVPELGQWMPEIEGLAERLSSERLSSESSSGLSGTPQLVD